MSVRVVARVRPLLKNEVDKDVIVEAANSAISIPNPKSDMEKYSFQFSSVYDQDASQSDLFDAEISPNVKHIFQGFDVTLFAYGVTGTGKTHTMRGGKSLAERGVIPRLLSAIYRKARKVEKDTAGKTSVEVVMSYYEIYNDRVFDLFEPPEKRTPAGLPIRDNSSGKAIVVGLTERPCTNLKDFEKAYDEANLNRSTSATKLNAHSSRSHAVLCVKVSQTTGDEVRVSTASAIDLAGSEDNRRTDNNKERLVESASINKSLFVLASCVEAISRKQARIPYRESKMTRILALGQNNGLTVMILNLAPVRSYHLDTLSSLNFANRTKKIEVNEIENVPFFRDGAAPAGKTKLDSATGPTALSMNRQPLRSKILSQNSHLKDVGGTAATAKPAKQFAVFSDKPKPGPKPSNLANTAQARLVAPLKSPKRTSSEATMGNFGRPAKALRATVAAAAPGMSQEAIERLIEQKVSEALALGQQKQSQDLPAAAEAVISEEVQRRLDALEKRVEGQETERAEGLQYLLMAKQHQVRGEDVSALKMYELALPHFPGNAKLARKIAVVQERIESKRLEKERSREEEMEFVRPRAAKKLFVDADDEDQSYHEEAAAQEEEEEFSDDGFIFKKPPRTKIRTRPLTSISLQAPSSKHHRTVSLDSATKHPGPPSEETEAEDSEDELARSLLRTQTPRTKQLLQIINSRDVSRIQLLKGVGKKKAEAIVNCLLDLEVGEVRSLGELGGLKGVGRRGVENMRVGMLEF